MTTSSKMWMALRNTVISWPPLILFVTCLITFSGVAFVLGAYVYNTEDSPDRRSMSWNTFLTNMEQHGFCPHQDFLKQASSSNSSESAVTLSLLLPSSGEQLIGNGSILVLEEPRPADLNVSLQPVQGPGGVPLLCVRVWSTGAAVPVPEPGRPAPPSCADVTTPPGAGSLALQTDPTGRCTGGRRRLQLKYTAVPAWDLTLSMVDRERVYTHLSCTSVFLVAMAVCMLLCTVLRNRTRYTLAAGDKVPLSDG